MSNRTDIVVETDNAEGQVLLSASRVYDLTEDKTQNTINSEVRNTLNQLSTKVGTVENSIAIIINGKTSAQDVYPEQYVYLKNSTISGLPNDGLYTYTGTTTKGHDVAFTSGELSAVSSGGLNSVNEIQTENILNTAYNVVSSSSFVIKSGNIKLLRIFFTSGGTTPPHNQYVQVGILPQGFYPSEEFSWQLYTIGGASGSEMSAHYEVRIYTSGEIKVYNYMSTSLSSDEPLIYI